MVIMTVFADTFAVNVLIPILALYAKDAFDATDTQVGVLFSVPCAAAFLFSFVLTWITQRFGRKPVFLLCLMGMGIAALTQGLATSYNMLLFGRAFGGAWVGVTSTAKVYINEVTSWDATGTECSYWLSQMTLFQNVAKLFAPGIGGALTHYGMGTPSLITSVVEMVGCCLVCIFVVESPQYLRHEAGKAPAATARGGSNAAPGGLSHCRRVLLFGLAQMFTTACMKLVQSVYALYAIRLFAVDSVDIGFIFLSAALATAVASRMVVPLVKRIGAHNSAIFFALIHAAAMLLMAFTPSAAMLLRPELQHKFSLGLSILGFCVAAAASSIGCTFQTILSRDLEDQPSVQARGFQFRQGGQIIIPLVATRLLEIDASYPWLFGALLAAAAALPCHYLKQSRSERVDPGFGDEWTDDVLAESEELELGRFVSQLLRKRQLRWSSQRDEVERILDAVIPEMPRDRRQFYEALEQYTQASSIEA